VAIAADIQTDRITDYERDAISQVLDLEPDLILLPGDFFQGSPAEFERELPAYKALLRRLHAPGGVFAVRGNVDGHGQRLRRLLADTGIQFLENETATVRINGSIVAIGGMGYPHDTPAAARLLSALDRAAQNADVSILLAHSPDAALYVPPHARIDLVVAGHTHGGQVQIPGIGPLMTGCRSSRKTSAGGLSTVNGIPVYVSRGVGHERSQAPRLRLFCPPDISLLTLRPQ
jgi:predicted MPP superfamily phosphohydrolase